MVHCVVVGCHNKSTSGSGKSFHTFPNKDKDKKTFKEWVVRIGRADVSPTGQLWQPTKHSRVCSDHFTPDCYTKNPNIVSSVGYVGDRSLRPLKGSVPTIFPSEKPENLIPASRGGFAKREKRRVLDEILQENLPILPEQTNIDECSELIDDCDFDARTDVCETSSTRCTAVQVDNPKTYVKTTQTKPEVCSQGVQTNYSFVSSVDSCTMTVPMMVDACTQCDFQCKVPPISNGDDDIDDASSVVGDFNDDESVVDDNDDGDWLPSDMSDDSDDSYYSDNIDNDLDITDIQDDPTSERKYIVFESCLKELFSFCRICGLRCQILVKRFVGTMITIEAVCSNNHKLSWNSQPYANRMPEGNLIVAGSILFSGASPGTVLNVFNCANISVFSDRTYRYIQSSYLIPAVTNVWRSSQTEVLRECEGRNVKLGGDARCCSPGHTAKYGSYCLMDLETGHVLAVQLVQVSEVKNSYEMEKKGLERALDELKARNLRITDLTTDRHVQVRKYMATEQSHIRHWFDVWHVAKGIYKKLLELSKKKGCESIQTWAQSISNHLYWAAASSQGDGELVKEKLTSMCNHVANQHEGHGDKFQRCLHGELDRNWILKDSKAHKMLCELLTKTRLLKDIQQLSPAEQTSKLEAYHKIDCQFAPKFQHFFYASMKARLLIAALHNNENCRRGQATKKDGTARWKLSYPKAKHGEHTLKKVKTDCTYDYQLDLLREAMDLRRQYPSYRQARVLIETGIPNPSTVNANRVNIDVAITRYRSRFNV